MVNATAEPNGTAGWWLEGVRRFWKQRQPDEPPPFQRNPDAPGDQWVARCPVCQAAEWALLISECDERDGTEVGCLTGCDTATVRRALERVMPEPVAEPRQVIDGASFFLDVPEQIPAVWGEGERILWAQGEPLLIVGPDGVGKTTLTHRLLFARGMGLGSGVLGLPVAVDPRPVLYVAADRPHQAAQSGNRMVPEIARVPLRDWVIVRRGPLPFDLGLDPDAFPEFVTEHGVGTVFLDSLGALATNLSSDEVGGRVQRALQLVVAEGVEVMAVHHQRKETSDGRKPRKLSDVYGSRWLTSGAGSVVLLWGEPGDPLVELRHLKQPRAEVGPLTLTHDHARGEIAVQESADLLALARASSGITVRDAAAHLFGTANPSKAEVEKARRRLDNDGRLVKVDGKPPVYRVQELRAV